MNTLDDELLSLVRKMNRLTSYQKKQILYPLNMHHNIIAGDGALLFLSSSDESDDEAVIKYGFELKEIFSLDCTDTFLIILCNDARLFIFLFDTLELNYWHPESESILSELSRWKVKNESGIYCLRGWVDKMKDCLFFIIDLFHKYKLA